jgi:hypothetical protein
MTLRDLGITASALLIAMLLGLLTAALLVAVVRVVVWAVTLITLGIGA